MLRGESISRNFFIVVNTQDPRVNFRMNNIRRLLPIRDDEHHYTGGFGIVMRDGSITIDAACNISKFTKEFLLSTVFRF